MGSTEVPVESPPRDELYEAPAFQLACIYDDPVEPSELTVYSPESERLTTEWLTVDRSAAVSLDRIR